MDRSDEIVKISNVVYDLTTIVKNAGDKDIEVLAKCICREKYESDKDKSTPKKILGEKWYIYIFPKASNDNVELLLGTATISINYSTGEKDALPHLFGDQIYRNEAGKLLPYMEIDYLQREVDSTYQYVGSAMHEAAFRLSLDKGCEGRIILDAVRNTHLFHYKHGFRNLCDNFYYYFHLSREIINLTQTQTKKLKGDFGSRCLYLPPAIIEANFKRYHLNHSLKKCRFIDYKIQETLVPYETLMQESFNNSLVPRILYELVNRHKREEYDETKDFFEWLKLTEKEEQEAPSLFCEKTDKLIFLSIEKLIQVMPSSSEEALNLAVIGIMIVVLAFQDKTYGAQNLYNNQLLYPEVTCDQLNDINAELKNNFLFLHEIGKRIVIDESMPFPIDSLKMFFPKIFEISEFKELAEHMQSPGFQR